MAKSPLPDDPAAFFEQKLERYCAYQERCSHDVMQKMAEWKIPPAIREKTMKHLLQNGFINDARYAGLFAGGKFRHNKWGRIRIRYELKIRNMPGQIIQESMSVIHEEEYLQTLRELIIKKHTEIKTGKNLNIREKIINFVTGKGFEFDLVAGVFKELKI